MAKQENDSGGGSILPVLLIAGGAYLVYELFFSPATTAAQASATPAPATPTLPQTLGTPTPATTSTPTPAPQPAYNSLAQIYQRFMGVLGQNQSTDPALSTASGQLMATPSVFNYYLATVYNNNLTADGLTQAFGSSGAPITVAAFWSGAAAWLAQTQGLSGIRGRGLAAALISGRRRR